MNQDGATGEHSHACCVDLPKDDDKYACDVNWPMLVPSAILIETEAGLLLQLALLIATAEAYSRGTAGYAALE